MEAPPRHTAGKNLWRLPVGTDPEAHIKTITDLFSSGATIVNIHSGQSDQTVDLHRDQLALKRLGGPESRSR
jgi:hypothetical protein